MKIAAFGEIIWDRYPDESCIGGAPLNFAAHAVRQGAEAILISAVGDDELGVLARKELARFGVDTAMVATVPGRVTGQCLVTLDDRRVPHYNLLSEVAYDRIPCETVPICDALVFGTLIQRSECNRRTLQRILDAGSFAEVFCDLNIRAPHYDSDSVERCCRHATILKVSREELPTVTELLGVTEDVPAAAQRLCRCYPNIRLCLVTCDCDGAYVWDARRRVAYQRPARSVRVVSTVGAGDSFGAAFLVSYLRTHDVEAALQAAVDVSAEVVAHKEAVPL